MFLLLDEPEVYGLPPAPRARPRATWARMWRTAGAAAAGLIAGIALVVVSVSRDQRSIDRRRSADGTDDGADVGYYGQPIVKAHVWKDYDRLVLLHGRARRRIVGDRRGRRADRAADVWLATPDGPRWSGCSRARYCSSPTSAGPERFAQHAARVQADLADERRVVAARRIRRRGQRVDPVGRDGRAGEGRSR